MFDGSIYPAPGVDTNHCDNGLYQHPKPARIGLFDSGVGGLSVLRAMQQKMPWLDYIYCGDTARLPYGKRKPETIVEYSMQTSRFLVDAEVDAIIIACNTASSVALGAVQAAYPGTLIKGVVEAGAQAAMEASQTGRIAVIGTECTVTSRAYEQALSKLNPTLEVRSHACPFLVSLAEEGWTDCDIAASVARKYLVPLFATFGKDKPDTLVLGCTHYSRFKTIIQLVAGPNVTLIDPADHLAEELSAIPMMRKSSEKSLPGTTKFHATDALRRFARVGELFLGTQIPQASLERITLDNQ